MAEKKLGVRLTAKDRLSKTLKGAGDAARKAGDAMAKMAVDGARAVEGLTRKLFFLKEAVNVVANAARGLWDMFITPAINARKLAVSLTNVFGGGTSQKIRQFAKDTGLSFETVSKAALDMGQKLDKAGGLDAYLKAVERVNKWRPDLGAEGAVAFVNDLVGKVTEATEGSSKQLGTYTSVMIGGTKGQAVDLAQELDKLGVVAKVADPATTALDRLREAWNEFAAKVGSKVLDKLAEAGIVLLEWLTKNEDKVLRLTDAFTNLINNGIQKLIDWIDSGGIDVLIEKFKEWWQVIKDIWAAVEPIVGAVGKVLGGIGSGLGGGAASDPWKGGEGGVGKSIGRTIGAAAGPGGFGKAAENMRMIAATGAAGLGLGIQRTFGWAGVGKGRNLAKDWGESVLNVPTAAEKKVQVTVGIDPQNGNVQAYVDNQIGEANEQMLGGAGMTPSFGWRGG